MLTQVADGMFVSQSRFMSTNCIVVTGRDGVLVIDPGILDHELVALAGDLAGLGQRVVAGFSTHPHWDHLLWHPRLGEAPRYGTERGVAAIGARLADPDWRSFVASRMPPDIVDDVPLDLFGLITALPAGSSVLPWDGPRVRVIEHRAHAPGSAALLIDDRVLVAGDLLSDILPPMLDMSGVPDPTGDYLAALELLEGLATDVEVVVPGHGSVGGGGDFSARIAQDRAYVQALANGEPVDDPRVLPS